MIFAVFMRKILKCSSNLHVFCDLLRFGAVLGKFHQQGQKRYQKVEQRYYGDVGGLGVMNPFAYSQVNNDVVKGELAHLGHGFSPPDSEKYGFNLRKVFSEKGQTAYDRFQELHGVVKLRGRTLEQSLERLFSSDRYQKMIDSPDSTTSPKVAEARKIISKYRAHAYRQIEKEFPELKNARLQSRKEYRARESGRSNSIQNILNY